MANVTKKQISTRRDGATGNQSHEANERAEGSVSREPRQWIGRSFADRESAERAYNLLLERGYESQDINLLMSKETHERFFLQKVEESALHHKVQEGTAEKVTEGAMKGIVVGTLLTVGANIILPGIGLFFGGPLFIGLGALTGGLSPFLIESGIPEQEALAYEEDVKAGRIVMGVKPQNKEDAEYFKREWALL